MTISRTCNGFTDRVYSYTFLGTEFENKKGTRVLLVIGHGRREGLLLLLRVAVINFLLKNVVCSLRRLCNAKESPVKTIFSKSLLANKILVVL